MPFPRLVLLAIACTLLLASSPSKLHADGDDTTSNGEGEGRTTLRDEALASLTKAVGFYQERVATEGGYLWRYSADLGKREGEGKALKSQVWVQPPGTPAVGAAWLQAWKATGEPALLDAAVAAARCLVQGQLRSGGWRYSIEFDPERRKGTNYRVNARDRGKNFSVLDDDTTQSALRLLIKVDQALAFEDAAIHEAAIYGLQQLLAAQQPSGAWPQGFDKAADPDWPVKKASYPDEWSRTYRGHDNYWHKPTLNDNLIFDVVRTLIEASVIYADTAGADYLAAAERAGDFLVLAQMPEPQPAWAQQYSRDMQPVWARKFEPPAVTGGESRTAITTLLLLYRHTGRAKFLQPIGPALDWFRRSALPDGRVARFYELRTNKPLYFTKGYELTYDDSDMPTHYAFKVGNPEPSLRREFEKVLAMNDAERRASLDSLAPRVTESLERDVRRVIAAQDESGAWIDNGTLRYHGSNDDTRRIIDCRTLIRNVGTLSRYLAASRE